MLRVSLLLVAIAALLFLYPLYPEVQYHLSKGQSSLFPKAIFNSENFAEKFPADNRLKIPSINVDAKVVDGKTEESLNRGVWRRPHTSTPDQKGNTVLTGHRFLYTGFAKNTFYNLDKVKVGDLIELFWKGVQYKYKVTQKKIVLPTAVEIEDDYGDKRLTLYTCHPLWTADKRLVVVAEPL